MGLILPADYSLRILLKLVQIGHLESFLPFPICTEENLSLSSLVIFGNHIVFSLLFLYFMPKWWAFFLL